MTFPRFCFVHIPDNDKKRAPRARFFRQQLNDMTMLVLFGADIETVSALTRMHRIKTVAAPYSDRAYYAVIVPDTSDIDEMWHVACTTSTCFDAETRPGMVCSFLHVAIDGVHVVAAFAGGGNETTLADAAAARANALVRDGHTVIVAGDIAPLHAPWTCADMSLREKHIIVYTNNTDVNCSARSV